MCTSPIHIKAMASPRFEMEKDGSICKGTSPFFGYDVPCGKCEECKKAKIDSYFLRVLTEYTNCEFKAVFSTLTYSTPNLPYLCNDIPPTFSDDGEHLTGGYTYRISTWSKSHVQKFIKALNEKLIFHVGTEILGLQRLVTIDGCRRLSDEWKEYLFKYPRPLKYLCVCERGSSDMYISDTGRFRFGTARPHYHIIFLINSPFITPELLRTFIADTWKFGHTYDIEIGKDKITKDRDISQSIGYVVKYVCKSLGDDIYKCYFHSHDEELEKKPFVLVSNHLGESLLVNYDDDEILHKLDVGISVPSHSGTRQINIPRYNLNKVCNIHVNTEKHLVARTPKDYFDFSSYPPVYICHSFCDRETYYYYKRTYAKSPLAIAIEKRNICERASLYADLHQQLLDNPCIFDIYKSKSFSKLSSYSYEVLKEFTPDDTYLFICNDLYITSNQHLNSTPIYTLYCLLREYSNTLTREKTFEHNLWYKQNISKAILAKPKLFERTPVLT